MQHLEEGHKGGLQALMTLGQQEIKLSPGIVLGHFQQAKSERNHDNPRRYFWDKCRGILGS